MILWHCLAKKDKELDASVLTYSSSKMQQDLTFPMQMLREHKFLSLIYLIVLMVNENGLVLFCMEEKDGNTVQENGSDEEQRRRWGRGAKMRQTNNEAAQLFSVNLFLHLYYVPSSWKLHIFISKSPITDKFYSRTPTVTICLNSLLLHKRLRLASAVHLIMKNSHAGVDLFCYESTYFIDVCR